MTYRERRERRAARLREWAEKREQKAATAATQVDELLSVIPPGQPILIGHHSEKRHRRHLARVDANISRYIEHVDKAQALSERADNIEHALDRSIYSDDDNAVERLHERIADLEAQRDRITAYNASCRKGAPDLALLDDAQRANLASLRKVCAWQLRKGGQFPTYATSNLSGNIKRLRDRMTQLEAKAILTSGSR